MPESDHKRSLVAENRPPKFPELSTKCEEKNRPAVET